MGKIVFNPSGLWQGPIRSGSPLVGSHEPVTHRRFVHDVGVLPLQPMVIPSDDLVVVLMEWPLEVGRSGENQFLRRINVLEIVLRTEPVKLVGVGVSSGSGVKRYPDFLENFFRALDNS